MPCKTCICFHWTKKGYIVELCPHKIAERSGVEVCIHNINPLFLLWNAVTISFHIKMIILLVSLRVLLKFN